MIIRMMSIVLMIGGIMLWMMAKAIPFLMVIGMDWVAIFMMVASLIVILFRFSMTNTGKQFDYLNPMQALINYIRRDGSVIPVVGTRVYSGESFLDIPRLGLIEDLGKDTVLSWGGKKIRFGLENINYTPDPKYMNYTSELARIGFNDSDELYMIMNIPYIKDNQLKANALDKMGAIYWNLTHAPQRGSKRLVESMKRRPRKTVKFKEKSPRGPILAPRGKLEPSQNFNLEDEVDKRIKEKL